MHIQNWRSDTSAKWDMIESGKWMQKAVWNRWVTTMERDQPHKTPITSTWTEDFLTREGEGRKSVGDWLRDKTYHGRHGEVSFRRMRVLSHARLAYRNGATIQMGYADYVNVAERWVSSYWGEDPLWAPPDICRATCVASKLHRIQGLTIRVFSGFRKT